MEITSIDLETTGTPTDEDPHAVCEIGWTKVFPATGDRWHYSDPHSLLCDPGRPVPAEAQAVHHIGDGDVAGEPPFEQQLQVLGPIDLACAHNAAFEAGFITNPNIRWICTYKVALRLWYDAPSHNLQFLRYWLGLDIDQAKGMPPHRAGPDAYVGAALMARILEEPNAPDIDTMVRWSSGPPLLHRVTFGKHRGSLWQDLPADYLSWIVNKSDLDADTKANARYRLKQRQGE